MSRVTHWLNREMTVWRPTSVSDGSGGQTVTMVAQSPTVMVKIDQASVEERVLAAQASANLTHNIYAEPDADIHRGDELRGDGEVYKIGGYTFPSTRIYRKLDAEQVQPQPAQSSSSSSS